MWCKGSKPIRQSSMLTLYWILLFIIFYIVQDNQSFTSIDHQQKPPINPQTLTKGVEQISRKASTKRNEQVSLKEMKKMKAIW